MDGYVRDSWGNYVSPEKMAPGKVYAAPSDRLGNIGDPPSRMIGSELDKLAKSLSDIAMKVSRINAAVHGEETCDECMDPKRRSGILGDIDELNRQANAILSEISRVEYL